MSGWNCQCHKRYYNTQPLLILLFCIQESGQKLPTEVELQNKSNQYEIISEKTKESYRHSVRAL